MISCDTVGIPVVSRQFIDLLFPLCHLKSMPPLSFPAAKKGMLAADTSFMVMLRVRLSGGMRHFRFIQPLPPNRSLLVGGFNPI